MKATLDHQKSHHSNSTHNTPFFSPAVIQPALTINEPGDQYEQEADQMADHVMRMESASGSPMDEEEQPVQRMPLAISRLQRQEISEEEESVQTMPLAIQRKCAECEKEDKLQRQEMPEEEPPVQMMPLPIQRKCAACEEGEKGQMQKMPLMRKVSSSGGQGGSGGYTASSQLTSQLSRSKGGGSSLPMPTLPYMNNAFGTDFSQVRVHTSSQANEMSQGIQAKAFTHGSDIYFNKGQYNPDSLDGKKLLAHELTHVVQQQTNNDLNTVKRQPKRQPEPIKVELVQVPTSTLSVNELILDNLNTKEAMLDNQGTALDNFQTIVNSSSAKSTIPKGVGEIIIESFTKFVFEKVLDETLKKIPAAKEIFALGKSIIEDIDKEKKRVQQASTSYSLGQFIVNHRTSIRKLTSRLKSDKVNIQSDTIKSYDALKTEAEKKQYRSTLIWKNDYYTKLEAGSHSPEKLFQMIATLWINQSNTNNHLFVRINQNWEVVTAHIHAPMGQKLAEQLLKTNIGEVNLNNFKIYKKVEYAPAALTYVNMDFDSNGKSASPLTANIYGQHHVNDFLKNIRTRGFPKTKILTGD